MPIRKLPPLSPSQVTALQDELLANADRLLNAALGLLRPGNIALARSLAILGMEESGKAIALHKRRVQMTVEEEGEPFVNSYLESLWGSHSEKLEVVHRFLVEEEYWFDTEPADPESNEEYLGTIRKWIRRHDKLKQRGFYVDIDKKGGVLAPTGVAEEKSVRDVIAHVHQIGWQLRLGEHIEAKRQEEEEQGVPPANEVEIEQMRSLFSRVKDLGLVEELMDSMRRGRPGIPRNNSAYSIRLSDIPFGNVGKPGYEAETRELHRLARELDAGENL